MKLHKSDSPSQWHWKWCHSLQRIRERQCFRPVGECDWYNLFIWSSKRRPMPCSFLKTVHRNNHRCFSAITQVLHAISTFFIPSSALRKIFSARPVFSPSVSDSSICFQSCAALFIHPSIRHHPYSLSIPLRLSVFPFVNHSSPWRLLLYWLVIHLSSLHSPPFLPALCSSSKASADSQQDNVYL